MTAADVVIYRRMRGVFWGLLVVGVLGAPLLLALAFSVPSRLGLYSQEAIEGVGTTPAVIEGGFGIAGVIGWLAAIILGATAGSVDLQRGVLRDLVLAGRPRWRIVIGRLLGAAVILLAVFAVSLALITAIGATVPPDAGIREWDRVWREIGQYLLPMAYSLPLTCGVALLVGSRGPAIVIFFVVALIVDNILSAIPKVGDWWQHVSMLQADNHVREWVMGRGDADYGAAAVLVGWALIPLVAGIVRISRRDL